MRRDNGVGRQAGEDVISMRAAGCGLRTAGEKGGRGGGSS